MVWQLNAPQFFAIAIIAFGVVGFWRGWRREVVSLAFALSAVLFLYIGGGTYLAQFLFVYLPRIINFVVTQKAGPKPATPSQAVDLVTAFVTFVVIVVLGYLIGNKVFEKAKTSGERILGVIPAAITGFAIMLSTLFVGNSLFTLNIQPIQVSSIGSYLLVIFVIAIVALVAGLVVSSAKKASAAKK